MQITNSNQLYLTWESLEEEIKNCARCPLHRSRRNPVPGEGSKNSSVMFVGEAPGATEDEMGRPFVGAAGKLLTMVMESHGMRREDVYITNVVKCRPPGNREPREDEINACNIFLKSQILLLKPRIIVTLGNIAGKTIFSMANREWGGIMKMRGKRYELQILGMKICAIPTIHPAAALYNPQLRSLFENDMKFIKSVVDEIISGETREAKAEKPKPKTLLDYLK
ncbi:MAG: type-4 uracil-DNA glycosylase [Ignisphaera sp.]